MKSKRGQSQTLRPAKIATFSEVSPSMTMAWRDIGDAKAHLPILGPKEETSWIRRNAWPGNEGSARPARWGGGRRVKKEGGGWKPNPIWLEEKVKAGSLKQLLQTFMSF